MEREATLDRASTSTFGERPLPLVVTAEAGGLDAETWAAGHRPWIEENVERHGAVLFRGFGVDTAAKLERFAHAISSDFPELGEESSPRHVVEGQVQTSTDYPAEYPIQFHNEFSYSGLWPLKIYFGCEVPAAGGGETPVADSRRILARLSEGTRKRFEEKGLLYRRNYLKGRGVSWQKAFLSEDPAEVEARCAERGIECEWLDDGGLRTRQYSPALARHPKTREEVWFNHGFFWNVRALEPVELREFMLMQPEDELSTNSYYGDGSPIEPEVIEEIRGAYEAETSEFPWQKGDVMLLDNMLVAHARRPYTGERRTLAVMAEGCTKRD